MITKIFKIGEIKKGKEIGYVESWGYYIWASCPDCNKERWIRYVKNKPVYRLCNKCANKQAGLLRMKTDYKGTIENPIEYDIRNATELNIGIHGKNGRHSSGRYIWKVCPDCKIGRWVRLYNEIPRNIRCHNCALVYSNKLRNNKKPGIRKCQNGYISIKVKSDHPYFCMANNDRYIFQHRLVMAQYLNRPLLKTEIIHHKNGNKQDNRIENLEVQTASQHSTANINGYNNGFKQGLEEGFKTAMSLLKGRCLAEVTQMSEDWFRTNGLKVGEKKAFILWNHFHTIKD